MSKLGKQPAVDPDEDVDDLDGEHGPIYASSPSDRPFRCPGLFQG